MIEYEFHPLANIFPLIEGQAYQDLMADVLKHGVREPISLFEGKILDGRNRYRAATAMGVPCDFRSYEGKDAAAFVISLNLHRRHLSESQRAMVAAKLANLGNGQRASPIGEGAVTQQVAADMLNVGKRSVERAREVLEQNPQEVAHAVEQGRMSVSLAAQVATLPDEAKAEIAAAPIEQMRKVVKAHVDVAKKTRAAGKPKTGAKADAIRSELKAAKESGVSILETYARLTLSAIRAQDSFTDQEQLLLDELMDVIAEKSAESAKP